MTAYPVRWTAEKSIRGMVPGWLPAAVERPEAPQMREQAYGLGTDRQCAKTARDVTTATLREWRLDALAYDVELVVSELVTNALRHAVPHLSPAWPIRLRLLHHAAYLVCAVQDPSGRLPVVTQEDTFAESGRGLHLVEALSAAWGWSLLRHGKVVWAAFAAPA
jgi:anti-sigma regulatory factor (Ser/Thr protein kinase)